MHPLDEYYRLLGLSSKASKEEIRKQYRKLALKYHPDKNSDPLAHEKFILINDAYEILTGKKKSPIRKRSTSHTQSRPSKEEEKKQREERIKKARERFEKHKAYEEKMILSYFQSLRSGWRWKTLKLLSIVCGFVALGMSLDLVLPTHQIKEEVRSFSKEKYNTVGDGKISLVVTSKNKKLWVENLHYHLYQSNPEIIIEESWIFHTPINIQSVQRDYIFHYPIHFTYYWASIILIPIFLIPLFIYFYKKNNPLFVILYHASLFIINFLVIYYLFTGDRWAHLFSFGYV